MQFLVIFIIFSTVMVGFILSLKFSRYKQTPERSGCCGGGHCEITPDGKVMHKEGHACSTDS